MEQAGQAPFSITIAPDKMSVLLTVRPAGADEITGPEIAAAFEAESIVCDEADDERIGRLIQALRTGNVPEGPVVIVKGVPPVHGTDGSVVDLVAANALSVDEQGNVSHYDRNVLGMVKKGEAILRIVPPTPHKDGRDVLGHTVSATPGKWPDITLGPNVLKSQDGLTLSATEAGQYHYKNRSVRVDPQLTVRSDVSFRSGNIDFEGDIVVDKDVVTGFELVTPKNVLINGAVEGATIEAGKSVTVRTGILGQHKGRVVAGDQISCRFANGCRLEAGGDISIAKYCFDSEIRCGGKFLIPQGVVAGGEITCGGGSVVGTLGSNGQKRTVIRVRSGDGRAQAVADMEARIIRAREQLQEHSEAFRPFQGRLKSIRGSAREAALRIAGQIKDLTSEIEQRQAEIRELLAVEPDSTPLTLEVRKKIFSSVEIILDTARTIFHKDMDGPVRIEIGRGEHSGDLVAISLHTGETRTLKTGFIDCAA